MPASQFRTQSSSFDGQHAGSLPRHFHIETFGCQMNVHDSEKMSGLLLREGHVRAQDESDADLVIVNTCSVRAKAESKLYSYLGRFGARKRAGQRILLGVTGCVAQQEGRELLAAVPYVDFVLGTHQVAAISDVVNHLADVQDPVVNTAMSGNIDELEPSVADRGQPGRAYVTIMEGCDKFCTFCVIPYTRGRERYRGMNGILREVEYLAASGFREIQLLGQNVNCWRDGEATFLDLLRAVERTPVRWIRFITSHPAHFPDQLAEWMGQSEKLCPQLHLPVQTASDHLLRRMRREYTAEHFRQKVARLRTARPDIALSTDIIVGFPGETEADFAATLRLCEEVRFASMFSFLYSSRPYSAASRWIDDVPSDTKLSRLQQLQAKQKQIQTEMNRMLVGRELEVLVEGQSRKDGLVQAGHSSCNRVVNFVAPRPFPAGAFARVLVTSSGPNSLFGEAI